MAFKSYKDEARMNWGCTDRQPDTDELKLGTLQRIADATEIMAREYSKLIGDRDMYKRWYQERSARCIHLEHSNAALRGQITKLRKRLGATW